MEKNTIENPRTGDEAEFDLKPITEEGKFPFACHPDVSCFNKCCHDINVILTPFDVLRMKKALKIKSDEFLAKYAHLQTYSDTDTPYISLKQLEGTNQCVFMTEKGCSIYESRPAVCRNYPLGLATQDPTQGQSAMPHFIIEEEMCMGHAEGQKWTIAKWKKDQGADELDRLNKPWLEIVSRLKSLRLKDDKDQKMNVFIMVSFDQDTFKQMVFSSTFLDRFDVSQDQVNLIKNDDEELLKFGFKWLNFILFNEGPIRPKK